DGFCYWGHAELVCYCPSSALLDELTKKNSDMADKLSNESIRHNARMYEIKESMFALKNTKASKHEIAANAYKLGYLDCMNGVSLSVEEHMADEAAVEKDGAKDGAVDKVRAYAEELVAGAASRWW
ncbi:unnamed protein product, partial [Prunus brigantina]